VLKKDQGITFDLLKVEPAPAGSKKKGESRPSTPLNEPNAMPQHILVPEVVREPRIHYYQVPRLGSYLAIKLEYNSCLFEEAFDFALQNYA